MLQLNLLIIEVERGDMWSGPILSVRGRPLLSVRRLPVLSILPGLLLRLLVKLKVLVEEYIAYAVNVLDDLRTSPSFFRSEA